MASEAKDIFPPIHLKYRELKKMLKKEYLFKTYNEEWEISCDRPFQLHCNKAYVFLLIIAVHSH